MSPAGNRRAGVSPARNVYLVPFVEDEETIFLKTIIPSRKTKREYGDD